MQQKTIKHIGYLALLILISGIITWQTNNLFYGILAFFFIGILIGSGDWIFSRCRELTWGFFANIGIKGQSSIIEDDILTLPSPYEPNVNYMCFRPGGSSVYWLPFHGMGDVFIIRENLVEHRDGATLAIGDYYIPEFTDLPIPWQRRILYKFGEDRLIKFSPGMHTVFFAETKDNGGITVDADDDKKRGINYTERFMRLEGDLNWYKEHCEDIKTTVMSSLNLQQALKSVEEKRYEEKRKKREEE